MAERPIDSLDQLMDGGVRERFNDALRKVWDNVYDPNTNPTAAREITMKVKIKPSERRDAAAFSVDIMPKLAPPISLSQTVMLQLNGDGSITATERTDQIPGQMNMDGGEEPLPTEVVFNVVKSEAQ